MIKCEYFLINIYVQLFREHLIVYAYKLYNIFNVHSKLSVAQRKNQKINISNRINIMSLRSVK